LRGEPPVGEPDQPIGQTAIWRDRTVRRDGAVIHTFVAHVEERFIVWSHDRELLARALGRPGELSTLIRPFAAVRLIPRDADAVACLLFRPGDELRFWGRLIPRETTVVAGCGRRIMLFHREQLPEGFLEMFALAVPPSTTSRDGWLVSELTVSADVHLELLWLCLAGLAIFM